MAVLQGLVFFVLGLGLLIVDYRSLDTGWLPCGHGIARRVIFTRNEQPIGYWLMFAVYGAGGFALLIFSLYLLAGRAQPLPSR